MHACVCIYNFLVLQTCTLFCRCWHCLATQTYTHTCVTHTNTPHTESLLSMPLRSLWSINISAPSPAWARLSRSVNPEAAVYASMAAAGATLWLFGGIGNHACVCMCMHAYVCAEMYLHAPSSHHPHVLISSCLYVYTYPCIRIYTCICTCIHAYFMSIYLYTYTHTHTHIQRQTVRERRNDDSHQI
jgi:hypothetical protein